MCCKSSRTFAGTHAGKGRTFPKHRDVLNLQMAKLHMTASSALHTSSELKGVCTSLLLVVMSMLQYHKLEDGCFASNDSVPSRFISIDTVGSGGQATFLGLSPSLHTPPGVSMLIVLAITRVTMLPVFERNTPNNILRHPVYPPLLSSQACQNDARLGHLTPDWNLLVARQI